MSAIENADGGRDGAEEALTTTELSDGEVAATFVISSGQLQLGGA